MKAKKMPSGNFRVRVYDHKDADGKQHYISFTAPTKKEAELKAAAYASSSRKSDKSGMTVGEAIDGYITAKEGVLSPSTINVYRKLQRACFGEIASMNLKKLDAETVQLFVSRLSEKLSPKTVRNVYGLLRPAVKMYRPDAHFSVTMPQKRKKKEKSPSSEEVKALYMDASDEMKKCILLAAFCSMRRGEICALKYGDICGNEIHIHADMVKSYSDGWVYKEVPKTSESDRFVRVPDALMSMVGEGDPEDFIIKMRPSSVTEGFARLCRRNGVSIRFHSLRHYFASIGSVLNVPDVYLAEFGGWDKNSPVMKSVYQNKIESESGKYAEKMAKYFDSLIDGTLKS